MFNRHTIFTGIQHAGAQLKELQRAFKNPTANLGLIFKEAQRRAVRSVGLGSGNPLTTVVHGNLVPSANLCSKVS